MAEGFLRQLRGESFLLLLVLVEFHLDEFVVTEAFMETLNELRAQAGLADLERGFQPLGGGFEFADFGIGKFWEHGCEFKESVI